MPVLTHVTTVPHPRSEVFAWHERPGALTRLTPPGQGTVLSGPTNGIRTGSRVVVRLSSSLLAGLVPDVPDLPVVGAGTGEKAPLGLTMTVRHGWYEPGTRFVDEQVAGPFRTWRHEHRFADGPDGSTVVTDTIEWELPGRLLQRAGTRTVADRLERLFTFRSEQLRADLDAHAAVRERLGDESLTVAISGASGLIGTQLRALLTGGGHRVLSLVRGRDVRPGEVRWDPAAHRLDRDALRGVDAVVNLSGRSIATRFTDESLAEIRSSRLDSAGTLVDAMTALGDAGPRTYVQAGGMNVYGARRPGETLTEESAPGDDDLARICVDWEAAARPAAEAGIRTVVLRTGTVLAANGGPLARQLPLFLAGAGGRLTAPGAATSWISLDDVARAYLHTLTAPELSGPVNAVAPAAVTAAEFAKELGQALRRPSLVPTPGFGPRLVLGDRGADALVDIDLRLSARKLLDSGFEFAHPRLRSALRHVLQKG
jgi:uncharacterized protein